MQAMALKSRPRDLSFDVLRVEEDQNDIVLVDPLEPLIGRKEKKKRSRKKRSVGKLIETEGIGMEEIDGVGNLDRYSVMGSSMLTVSHEGGAGIGNLDGFQVGGKGKMVKLGGFEMGEKGRIGNLKGFEVDGMGKIGNLGVFEEGERGKMVNLGSFEVGERGKMVNLDDFEVEGRGKMVNLDDFEMGETGRNGNLKGFEVEGRGKIGNLDGFEEGREGWSGGNGVGKFGGELRQRNVGLSGGSEEVSSLGMGLVVEENGKEESNSSCGSSKNIDSMNRRKMAKELLSDSNNVMANDRRCK